MSHPLYHGLAKEIQVAWRSSRFGLSHLEAHVAALRRYAALSDKGLNVYDDAWAEVAKMVDESAVAAYAAAGMDLPSALPLKRKRGVLQVPPKVCDDGAISLPHGVASAWLAFRTGMPIHEAWGKILGLPPHLDDWWYEIAERVKESQIVRVEEQILAEREDRRSYV